jgi:hypothetical protein
MAETSRLMRCLLCNGATARVDVTRHLRVVHQVAPGEITRADVPVGLGDTHPMQSADCEEPDTDCAGASR